MIAHSAPWYKWHNILQTLTVFYKLQNKQEKVLSSLLFSDGFVVIEMCVFVSVLIVKVAKDYFLNACIEWEEINVHKFITIYLKLDQWNKVALKQKEVLALYLFLLSPSGLFSSWYFYQPCSSTATTIFNKMWSFFLSFPTDLSCLFLLLLFLIFVHAFVHINKRYAGVDQSLVWMFYYSKAHIKVCDLSLIFKFYL